MSDDREKVKDEFIAARGYWKPWTEQVLRHDPAFLSLYARYAGHPASTGPLSPLMCELIYVVLDASSTHLFVSGLRTHIALALKHGATSRQIVEVLRIATGQGLDGYAAGGRILIEELEAAGIDAPQPDARQTEALRRRYEETVGEWTAETEAMLRLDPVLFSYATDLLAGAADGGGIDEKQRTLLRVALAACFLAYNPERLREQIRRALRFGCPAAEIAQVIQMTTHLGVHAFSLGMPILSDVIDEVDGSS